MNLRYASAIVVLSSVLMALVWFLSADRAPSGKAESDTRLLVVVAAPPYQAALNDFVDQSQIHVESLLGPAGDVHHQHFTPSQLRRAAAADIAVLPALDEGHEETDPHLWLNASRFADYILDVAGKLNAVAAAHSFLERRTAFMQVQQQRFAPLVNASFIVAHDAFTAFEAEIGLTGKLGALTSGHDVSIGAKSLRELRAKAEGQKLCVLHAPHADTNRIATMLEGASLTLGEADPLLWNDPSYLNGMQRLADAFYDCLTEAQSAKAAR